MPPYTVQYLCPRQSPLWQGGQSTYNFAAAKALCFVLKPPKGRARVLDGYGRVVFSI
jgi:hypothetical protein